MENHPFDQEVEDIIQNYEDKKSKKKGVNSGDKGHRGERGACKILSERFNGKPFERVMGSGNRWAQVKNLPRHAKDSLLGDICAPENFLWVIEVKNGYEDKIDFVNLLLNGNKQLDEFLQQAKDESHRAGKPPMLLYKRSRRPWLCMIPSANHKFEININYKGWTIVALEEILKLPDSFFFNTP